jgi:hypothetical protein
VEQPAAGAGKVVEGLSLQPGHPPAVGSGETDRMAVALLIIQRQQMHNRDMTQERRHVNGHGLTAAVRWVRSHLLWWRRRPPMVGVREPRRPKPTLPGAAVALKEPRTMRWIKLGNRHSGEHAEG